MTLTAWGRQKLGIPELTWVHGQSLPQLPTPQPKPVVTVLCVSLLPSFLGNSLNRSEP